MRGIRMFGSGGESHEGILRSREVGRVVHRFESEDQRKKK